MDCGAIDKVKSEASTPTAERNKRCCKSWLFQFVASPVARYCISRVLFADQLLRWHFAVKKTIVHYLPKKTLFINLKLISVIIVCRSSETNGTPILTFFKLTTLKGTSLFVFLFSILLLFIVALFEFSGDSFYWLCWFSLDLTN